MPKFKKVELVEARQFTGGLQNGSDLAFWVNSNNAKADWRAATDEQIEKLFLSYNYKWGYAYIGDWIVLHQDGTITSMRPQDFEATYDHA